MKCFFALSACDARYDQMVRVLVRSAIEHTNLELHCVLDQPENSTELADWLEAEKVTILPWQITFLSDLIQRYDGTRSLAFCRGTYLCMELPKVVGAYGISDEIVLYVDVDTMFQGPVELGQCCPAFFSSAADWDIEDHSRFSTGVMVMNSSVLIDRHNQFVRHLRAHNYNFANTGMGPCDQGAWNTFYGEGEHDWLPPEYDWKPWWGINRNARIVHFSGPKPMDIDRLRTPDKLRHKAEHLHACLVAEYSEAYEYFVRRWSEYVL